MADDLPLGSPISVRPREFTLEGGSRILLPRTTPVFPLDGGYRLLLPPRDPPPDNEAEERLGRRDGGGPRGGSARRRRVPAGSSGRSRAMRLYSSSMISLVDNDKPSSVPRTCGYECTMNTDMKYSKTTYINRDGICRDSQSDDH
jgi:hypothetical protein